ncbi:MAG TPA: NAD-dependent epimerase/dehydratase family protein [Solirubrobacteraceae bacterium]|nr:NAD-dependent epimerase/dehydratase family protein [Solirubrobacteraceae bacterium]
MRLLVLGGTGFVGRHIAELALARGDEVTLFNRGRSAPRLFPDAELRRGDRGGDLSALAGDSSWDGAIDVTGYRPQEVDASSRLLAERVERLTFISTVSVYADVTRPGVAEDAPLAALAGTGGWEDYGALKALCEDAVRDALPARALIVRPCIVAGPHDPTNRFSWWVARCARGGRVPAPAPPERPIQLIDARDLAAFVLDMTGARATGTYNAVGEHLTWADMLAACCAAAPGAAPVWVPEAELVAAGVDESQLPLWIPEADPVSAGFMRIDGTRAVAAGLRRRSLELTARDTRAALRPEDGPGLDPAVEARLIAA